jgi:hypothetical protein
MTSLSASQLTLSLEHGVVERWPSLREFIAHRVDIQSKLAKTIASDMDMSPSMLSRKLNPGEADTSRFNLDDLEKYLASTGDTPAVIEYLATKFAPGGDDARRVRAVATVEALLPELARALTTLKGGKK